MSQTTIDPVKSVKVAKKARFVPSPSPAQYKRYLLKKSLAELFADSDKDPSRAKSRIEKRATRKKAFNSRWNEMGAAARAAYVEARKARFPEFYAVETDESASLHADIQALIELARKDPAGFMSKVAAEQPPACAEPSAKTDDMARAGGAA
jgi:hypothetical protein